MKPSAAVAFVLAVLIITLAPGPMGAADASDYLVRPDDKLRIRVYQIPELSGEYVVASNGTVSMAPIGEILVAGLALSNIAARVSEHLINNGLSQNPGTTVELVQVRPIYILGDVQRPGEYPFRPGITVLQAVSVAGGYFRFNDPGLLRLERDAISSRGELKALARRLTYLRARRARLSAELEDRSDIAFPPEMLREAAADVTVAQLLDEERSLLTLNRTALKHQLESLERAHDLYEREIQTISAQIQAEKRQFEAVQRELNEIKALSSRGLAPVPRQTGLERTQAQIMSAEQGLHTLILRARQNITSVEQKRFELQSERRAKVNAELQQARLDIEEVVSKIETTQKLVIEAEVIAPGFVRRAAEMMASRKIVVVRVVDGDVTTVPVQEDLVLEPGDVLKVHPNEPSPTVGVAERAEDLPTGSIPSSR